MEGVSPKLIEHGPGFNQILVVGDALIDHQYWIDRMPGVGEDTIIRSFLKNVGGSAANTAIALAYLSSSSAIVSKSCISFKAGSVKGTSVVRIPVILFIFLIQLI